MFEELAAAKILHLRHIPIQKKQSHVKLWKNDQKAKKSTFVSFNFLFSF